MNTLRPKTYHFAEDSQWQQCVLHRFDIVSKSGLMPTPRLGLHALRIAEAGVASRIAVDPHDVASWCIRLSTDAGSAFGLRRFDSLGQLAPPLEIPNTLATSPRWIADGRWIWGFSPGSPRISRYNSDTLELDIADDVSDLCVPPDGEVFLGPLHVVDIASDGHRGLWALVRATDKRDALLHLDCEWRPAEFRLVPCEAGPSAQLGTTDGGESLVLLPENGRTLLILCASSGKLRRQTSLPTLSSCAHLSRLATDTGNRIVLWRPNPSGSGEPAPVFILDGQGDTLDGPFSELFGAGLQPDVLDVAVTASGIWFATADGVWRLGSNEENGVRESQSVLLTPVLDSPPDDTGRGWLRAEVNISLPPGATLEAQFASTDDPRVAEQIRQLIGDTTLSAEQRQQAVWDRLEPTSAQKYLFTAAAAPGGAIAVPLFESQDRWLWLGLKLVAPPGVSPPAITGLKVRYPDLSIMQQLPAIFRGEKNDPGGFMRRLVGVLEATTQQMDERIRTISTHIVPDSAPDDWLDYLAQWLGIPWEDGLLTPVKRNLLRNAGALIANRGTREGLGLLLDSLLNPDHSASIIDMTVDHAPARLGGVRCKGPQLPVLLAGTSTRIATLGAKAVLGTAHLACQPTDCSPFKDIFPTVRIDITGRSSHRHDSLIERILMQYIPAGVRLSVRWHVELGNREINDIQDLVLDANGPGALGRDSQLGRTVLIGHGARRIDDSGLDLGFHLQ